MPLTLKIISSQKDVLGPEGIHVFSVHGGTIGRSPDNDWVLSDPKRIISGHHCDIVYRGGSYWLRDTSTNGVFVNDAEEPVSSAGPVELSGSVRRRLDPLAERTGLGDVLTLLAGDLVDYQSERYALRYLEVVARVADVLFHGSGAPPWQAPAPIRFPATDW